MTKILSLLVAILISSSLFAGISYEECIGDYQTTYQKELASAKALYDYDYEYCFKYPVGEEFHSCTYEAYDRLNKANQAATDKYFEGMQYCLKYPATF